MGQPKIKHLKLHELHKNEVKNVHPIMSICPAAPETYYKSISKFGGVKILWVSTTLVLSPSESQSKKRASFLMVKTHNSAMLL